MGGEVGARVWAPDPVGQSPDPRGHPARSGPTAHSLGTRRRERRSAVALAEAEHEAERPDASTEAEQRVTPSTARG